MSRIEPGRKPTERVDNSADSADGYTNKGSLNKEKLGKVKLLRVVCDHISYRLL